jgi:hypothetical protein
VLSGVGIGPEIIAPAEIALDDSLDAVLAEVNSQIRFIWKVICQRKHTVKFFQADYL